MKHCCPFARGMTGSIFYRITLTEKEFVYVS